MCDLAFLEPTPSLLQSNMSFVSEKCKHFTLINGKADVLDLEEHGITISFQSDCLPPTMKKCKFSISAEMTTDIPLPFGSLLTSGVYHIATMPHIDQFNQPVEICMEHCANHISNLCFVVAKDNYQQKFEYRKGGTFEIDAKTGRKVGRIRVSTFSTWAIVLEWIPIWSWFTRPIAYCGRVYYEDFELNRTVHFVITKDLQLAKDVRVHIHSCTFYDHVSFLKCNVYFSSLKPLILGSNQYINELLEYYDHIKNVSQN